MIPRAILGSTFTKSVENFEKQMKISWNVSSLHYLKKLLGQKLWKLQMTDFEQNWNIFPFSQSCITYSFFGKFFLD